MRSDLNADERANLADLKNDDEREQRAVARGGWQKPLYAVMGLRSGFHLVQTFQRDSLATGV